MLISDLLSVFLYHPYLLILRFKNFLITFKQVMMGKIQLHIRNQEQKIIRNHKKLCKKFFFENLLPSVIIGEIVSLIPRAHHSK